MPRVPPECQDFLLSASPVPRVSPDDVLSYKSACRVHQDNTRSFYCFFLSVEILNILKFRCSIEPSADHVPILQDLVPQECPWEHHQVLQEYAEYITEIQCECEARFKPKTNQTWLWLKEIVTSKSHQALQHYGADKVGDRHIYTKSNYISPQSGGDIINHKLYINVHCNLAMFGLGLWLQLHLKIPGLSQSCI